MTTSENEIDSFARLFVETVLNGNSNDRETGPSILREVRKLNRVRDFEFCVFEMLKFPCADANEKNPTSNSRTN